MRNCDLQNINVRSNHFLLLTTRSTSLSTFSNGAEIDREVKNHSIMNVYFRRAPYTRLIKKGLGCLWRLGHLTGWIWYQCIYFCFWVFVYDHLHYYTSQLETLISSKICMLVLKNLNTDLQMKGKAIIKNMFVSPKPTLNIEVG